MTHESPRNAEAHEHAGRRTDSVSETTDSGTYAPCRVCNVHSAPNAERICRRCSISRARLEAAAAYARWNGITVTDALNQLDRRRRAARWRAELRRLDEIARLKRKGDPS